MKKISVEDRTKIQSHLAEIWKILYANGLEDLEYNRSPNSKQKRRMCEMNVLYNKDHSEITDGFRLSVSDIYSCWHGIDFETTKSEDDRRKRCHEAYEIQSKRNARKLKR